MLNVFLFACHKGTNFCKKRGRNRRFFHQKFLFLFPNETPNLKTMSQFVHLHVHTQYSILDGASDIKKIVARAKELGMPALAITDHGNMYGVKEFHDVATKAGLKPILGCEVYVVRNRFEKDRDEKAGDHLVLLAKNKKGYQNLCKIVSYSWTEGFYYKPRVDKELLRRYGEGLICSSACLGGEIPQLIMRGDLAGAEAAVLEFKEIFCEDYYLEMQLHKAGDERDQHVYVHQVEVNRELRRLAAKHNIKLICSNDVHFVMKDDALAHDLLICLNTNRYVDEENRMRYTFQEYLKSADEMAELFPEDAEDFVRRAAQYEGIEIKGLMTMAPAKISSEEYKAYFSQVKSIFDGIAEKNIPGVTMETLSMGMSDSYTEGAECGATLVRVGSAIFGKRIYPTA